MILIECIRATGKTKNVLSVFVCVCVIARARAKVSECELCRLNRCSTGERAKYIFFINFI